MHKRYRFGLLVLVLSLLLLVAAVPFAPDIVIDWWAIGPGSQTSTVGSVTLEGVVGQPAAGTITIGSIELHAGFLQALGEWLSHLFLPLISR